jgi:hypothetical protein
MASDSSYLLWSLHTWALSIYPRFVWMCLRLCLICCQKSDDSINASFVICLKIMICACGWKLSDYTLSVISFVSLSLSLAPTEVGSDLLFVWWNVTRYDWIWANLAENFLLLSADELELPPPLCVCVCVGSKITRVTGMLVTMHGARDNNWWSMYCIEIILPRWQWQIYRQARERERYMLRNNWISSASIRRECKT